MIREAMQYLHERFVAGQHATHLPWLDEPRARSYALGGQVVRVERSATPRRLEALELVDFCDAYLRYGDPAHRSIWHAEGLIGVLDDRWRDEWVKLPLGPSDLWASFVGTDAARACLVASQAAVCARLRSELYGLLDEAVVRKLEKIAATSGGRVEGEAGRNRDRGVHEFQAEIAASVDLPDTVALRLPRWSLRGCPVDTLRASVECDPRSLALAIRVLPGEVDALEQRARHWLRTTLCELLGIEPEARDAAPIFWGEPNLVS